MGKQIVVIGGGIMGLCSAYYLYRDGHEVTVIDQSGMDAGASYVNAGFLTPSHIVPLAAPGMIRKGLMWMFDSSSPFYMKPRWDPDFFRWAWYFYRSSTPDRVARAMPLIAEINVLSRELYQELHKSGDLGDFQLESTGLLMLYKTLAAAHSERRVMDRAIDLGLEATALTRKELDALQPGLSPEIEGAIHYLCDGHTTPVEIMPKLKTFLEKVGVRLVPGTPVDGFATDNNQILAARSGQREFPADEVVLASGSWSPELASRLDLKLSLQAGKGYRIDLHRETPVRYPAVLMESKVAVTPMRGFTRLAGTMEFSGINHDIRPNRVAAIARSAESYYPELRVSEVEQREAACGLRPVSPDGLPYIGRTSRWNNLSLATGHAMMGWSLGPVTGKLIAEVISGKNPSLSLESFSPDRRFT